MVSTATEIHVLVGEDKIPLRLTDSAVAAIQGEAAGRMLDAMSEIWTVEKSIDAGEGFDALHLEALLSLRDALRLAINLTEALIECRPLSELDVP